MNEMMHDAHIALVYEISDIAPDLEPCAVLEDAAFFEYPAHIAFRGDDIMSECWIAMDKDGFIHGEITENVVETWLSEPVYIELLALLAKKGKSKVDAPDPKEVEFY